MLQEGASLALVRAMLAFAHERPDLSYAVQISPRAWRQIGGLSWADFQEVRLAMTGLARTALWIPTRATSDPELRPARFSLEVETLVLRCEVDHPSRAIQLLELGRLPTGAARRAEESPSL